MFLPISIGKKSTSPKRSSNKYIIAGTNRHAAMKMFQFVFITDRDSRVTLGKMTHIYVLINRE